MPLDAFALAPLQTQTVPNSVVTTSSPYAQEQAAMDFLAMERNRGAGTQTRISDFYTDPNRMNELSAIPTAQANLGFANLREGMRQRSLQEAFARARAGLGTGSVHAEQQAQLDADATRAGAHIANQQMVQQDTLRRGLQQDYLRQLLGTMQLTPAAQSSVQARLTGVTEDADRVAAEARIRAAMEADSDFANDELSRIAGNTINTAGNAYQSYQLNSAYLQGAR